MSVSMLVGLRIWRHFQALKKNCCGQDLIEYALMAGLVATGVVTMSPGVADSFVDILSKVNSVVVLAGGS
jgi:Flp pilus assembly pilin Flp